MKPIDLVDLAEASSGAEPANDATAKQKSNRALRTISEAAELLDVPQHVLRFWETKFPQIKPMKRNGGRRFYRPEDIDTLQQVKTLLYKQGFTIKGARKALEQGGVDVAEMPEQPEQEQAPVIGGVAVDASEDKGTAIRSLKASLLECKKMLSPFTASSN